MNMKDRGGKGIPCSLPTPAQAGFPGRAVLEAVDSFLEAQLD